MNRFRLTLGCLITLVSYSPLIAHPGHGSDVASNSTGILHYLTEPIHFVPLAAIGLFVILFFTGKRILQRSVDQQRPVIIRRKDRKQ